MKLKDGYQQWLSLGFLKSKIVIATALSRIGIADFTADEIALKVIFKIGKEWYEAHRSPVPLEHIQHIVTFDLVPNKVLSEQDFAEFVDLVGYVYGESKSDVEGLDSYIQDVLADFLEDRKLRPAVQKLLDSPDIFAELENFRGAISRSQVIKAEPLDPFACALPMISSEKKIRWNCDFIDSITGGATRGETTLFLAPSGGGKTLSNIQIACATALAGEDALILSYEQAVHPGLTSRAYAYVLGKPVNYFQGVTTEEFNERLKNDKQLRDTWNDRKTRMQGKLHMMDMLELMKNGGANGGVQDIENIIKKMQDKGHNPRYVGLDWFGPFIDNYMASGRHGKNMQKHHVMQHAANELRILGGNLGINLFIYHQLGTAGASRRPIDLPLSTDALDCRTLHHYMDTVICIGNRTISNNLAFACVPKQRSSEPNLKACIQMDGANSKWKYVADKVIDDGNGGITTHNMLYEKATDDDDDKPVKAKAFNSTATMGYIG